MRRKQYKLRQEAPLTATATPGGGGGTRRGDPAPTGSGTGGGGSRSPVQLNFKSHCLFCLERQTPEQIFSIVKANPKKLENFQPVISYLRERECKQKNIPIMGNLPPMCQFCYNVFARLYKLHVDLQTLQGLIQEQTMKGRRILEKSERTRRDVRKVNVTPTPSNRQKFYCTLQQEGMPKEQFELVKGFVDNLHDLIVSQGDSEVKYPTYPDLKYGQPRKLPVPVGASSSLQQQGPITATAPLQTAPPASGILIPVQLLPVSGGATTQMSNFHSLAAASGINTRCQVSLATTTNLTSTTTTATTHPRSSTGRVVTDIFRSQLNPLSTSIIVKERNNEKIVDEVIDLCEDSDDDMKSVKEEDEEEEAMEIEIQASDDEGGSTPMNYVVQNGIIVDETTKSAKGEAEEEWGSDREGLLNDPLWTPPSQTAQSSDDELEGNMPVETVMEEKEQDEIKTETEDPLAYEDESESIQPRPSSLLPKVLPVAPAPTTTVLTFTNMITLGSGSMPFQLVPLMTTTAVPLFSGPIVNLDPLATTNAEKAVPPPKPKRKRKPRIRIRKKREPKPKRKIIRKPAPRSPFFQRCDICNEFLERDAVAMNDHLKTHTGKDGYSCTSCNRTFATKRLFFTHIRRRNVAIRKECDQHRRKLLPEFFSPTCVICDENVPVKMESFRLREFYFHLFSVHEKDTSLEECHECKICGSKFRTENGLDFHINEHMHESRKKVMERLTSVADLRLGLPQKRYTLRGLVWAKSGSKKFANKSLSSNKLSCTECGKCFDNEDMLEGHIKLEHTLRQCKFCDYSSSRFGSYMVHLRDSHPTDKPCDICWTGEGKDVKFESLGNLRAHYFEVHGVGRELVCEFCDRKCLCRNSLTTHQRMAHNVQSATSKRQRREAFEKVQCRNNSSNDGGMKSHKRIKRISHQMTTFLKCQQRILPGRNTTTTKEKEVQCEHCLNGHDSKTIKNKGAFYTKGRLVRHINYHHRHKCRNCEGETTFLSASDLKEHGKKEHPELWYPLDCPTCKRTIFGHQKLKTHMANHLNPYNYSCPICSRKFQTYLTLYQHKFVHDKEASFVCEQCGRGFKQRRLLRWHMQVHLPGGRPKKHTCEFCGKSYGDKITMLRHIKAHHPTDDAT